MLVRPGSGIVIDGSVAVLKYQAGLQGKLRVRGDAGHVTIYAEHGPQPAAPGAPALTPAAADRCHNCGRPLAPGSPFCDGCGVRL